MHILIYCGGMPFNGKTFPAQSLGGSESAAYYVAKDFASRGHHVLLWCNTDEDCEVDGVKYMNPGQRSPANHLGDRFEFYAQNTPHDLLIIQRDYHGFLKPYASDVNFLWSHDLAVVRGRDAWVTAAWNYDRVLTVSEYHKQQISQVYDLKSEARNFITPIHNGVDLSLYGNDTDTEEDDTSLYLFYQSRPERGLQHLVRPGGIMDQLQTERPDAKLLIAGYDHNPEEMQGMYAQLHAWADALPNVRWGPCLPKGDLAKLQQCMDLWVYPTEFEEVSCITAMEMMAAGVPGIASAHGALPETCKGSGIKLVNMLNGEVNEQAFVRFITDYDPKSAYAKRQQTSQLEAAKEFTWSRVADEILQSYYDVCKERCTNSLDVANHLRRHSDILALQQYVSRTDVHNELTASALGREIIRDAEHLYNFADDLKEQKKHYEDFYREKFYVTEWSPDHKEDMRGNPRYEELKRRLATLPAGSKVLDYGCFHGHITIPLAQAFPDLQFIGHDISEEAIDRAYHWQREVWPDDTIANVSWTTDLHTMEIHGPYDAIIAAEVFEHVKDPYQLFYTLQQCAKPDAIFLLTTPFGPWEWASYDDSHPWRFHLWHFTRDDLTVSLGHFPEFDILCLPAGYSTRGEPLGWYMTCFSNDPDEIMDSINITEKISRTIPRQTLAANLLVRNGEESLLKTLNSISSIVDEVVIGIDEGTTDGTEEVIERWSKSHPSVPVVAYELESPMESGFDAARNDIKSRTSASWILMIDADEVMVHPEDIPYRMRPSMMSGFALPQHHHSVEPLGVIDTDFPCRVFRNNEEIRYEGVVHEHPERGNNQGPGMVVGAGRAQLSHNSYTTEDVRRQKFTRNIGLMVRDREMYPDRLLGRFLWIRDLALMVRFDLERTGGGVTEEMRTRAFEGLRQWEEAVAVDHPMTPRLIRSGLEFYDTLSRVIPEQGSFEYAFVGKGSKLNGGPDLSSVKPVSALFHNRKHLNLVLDALIKEDTQNYENPYY